MENKPDWDKINRDKENSIAWMNAKNNAAAIASSLIQSNSWPVNDPSEISVAIRYWAEWFYNLEPTQVKKAKKVGTASAKQKKLVADLLVQKEAVFLTDDQVNALDKEEASKIISRLINEPTIETGDTTERHEGFDPDVMERKPVK